MDKTKNSCTHHWRIAEPEGPTSEGHCVRCGNSRTFMNATSASWDFLTNTEHRALRLVAEYV